MSALNGIIVLDKPGGISSNQALSRLKRVLGRGKMGFLGTLDPLATGVLPVFLGKATRLIPLFEGQDKRYRVTIRFGEETDSYDSDGKVLHRAGIDGLTEPVVREAILAYQGEIEQRPPTFSAIKTGGVPSYRTARHGHSVDLPSRRVRIWDVTIESVSLPEATFTLSCSAGTYVRSMAHEIGQQTGAGAIVAALRRLVSGSLFTLERAIAMAEIEQSAKLEKIDFVVDPVDLLPEYLSLEIRESEEDVLRRGQVLPLPPHLAALPTGSRMKALRACGTLAAVGESALTKQGSTGFKPDKVLI